MKIVISSGHGKKIRGASGSPVPPQCDEVDEARKVVNHTAEILRDMDHNVVVFHDDVSTSQGENLDRIVDFHNSQTRDIDVSIHFNAYDGNAHGIEVLYTSSAGKAYATDIVNAMCAASGLTNRGPKERNDLAFLNGCEAVAVLVETAFCDNTSDCQTYKAKFHEICAAIAEGITGEAADVSPDPGPEPEPPRPRPPEPEGEHPTIKKGDQGEAVAELQEALGVLITDGEFGSITDTWVRAFQSACGLKSDGVVGPVTWEEVDDLNSRVALGSPRLPKRLEQQIVQMAEASEIQEYLWPDRGMSPPGMVAGLALSFAHARRKFGEGDDAATVMAKAPGNPDKDALAWLAPEFKKIGLTNQTTDQCLRSVFVLLIGLAMRESSGRYCEGRDLSASNVQADTAESGIHQTSWNIRSGSDAIPPLLPDFWDNPQGFRDVFKLDVNPTKNNLDSYGTGDGAKFQFLSRFAPLLHILVTAVGVRVLRQHHGPINRKEVTLKKEADDLLKEVERLVDAVA